MDHNGYKERFGVQLRWLRQQHQLTLKDLEECSGISSSSLSAYERGDGNPTLQALESLASSFSVPISYLLGQDQKQERQLAVDRLTLEYTVELLRFSGGSGGPDELQFCLSRCTELLLQAMRFRDQEKNSGDTPPC